MKQRPRRTAGVVLGLSLLALAMVPSAPAAVDTGGRTATPDAAQPTIDVQLFSQELGITIQVATEYLERQPMVGSLDAYLSRSGPDSFGGLYIDYKPSYQIVLLSTNGNQQDVSTLLEGSVFEPLTPLFAFREVDYTVHDLEQTIVRVEKAAGGVEFAASTYIRTGRVSFSTATMSDAAALETTVADLDLPIPTTSLTISAEGLTTLQDNSYGGLNLNTQGGSPECVTGFTVEPMDGTGEEGISTAGHCVNSLEFNNGDDINFQSGQFGGDLDAQWHTTPGYDDKAWVKDAPGSHAVVTDRDGRDEQPIGAFVCLTRRDDDVRCGTIEEKSFDPGSGFNAHFIRVDGSQNLSGFGDSGGPWYLPLSTTAYGIHHGEPIAAPSQAIYMAVNYLSGINRRVKINPPG